MSEEHKYTDNTPDEIVVVQMPRKDYKILRSMIDREKVSNSVWKWTSTVFFIGLSGLLSIWVFGEKVLAIFK